MRHHVVTGSRRRRGAIRRHVVTGSRRRRGRGTWLKRVGQEDSDSSESSGGEDNEED
jgi:hypothetical protein